MPDLRKRGDETTMAISVVKHISRGNPVRIFATGKYMVGKTCIYARNVRNNIKAI